MLRSIREPLNDIPSFVNDTPMILPLRLSSLKFTPMPCLTSLPHNSDQLLQRGKAALTASWIWYFTLSLPRRRSRFTFTLPLEKCRPYSLVRALHTATLRMASFRSLMVFPSLSTLLATMCKCWCSLSVWYFSHQSVRQLWCVLVGKVQRDVVHRIFQLAPRLVISLSLHTRCYGCIIIKPHVLAVYEPCLFWVVHVVHQLGEARPFLQVAHHILSMILLNSSSRVVIFSLVLGKPC